MSWEVGSSSPCPTGDRPAFVPQTLREEVALLKEELQKSETAAATLLDELSGTRWPDVQEKIWLRQEVPGSGGGGCTVPGFQDPCGGCNCSPR